MSATWEFWARKNSGVMNEADSSFGAFPDFNGDGLGDIAEGGGTPTVSVYLGAPKLGPNENAVIAVSDATRAQSDYAPNFSFGDIDGDGLTDLVMNDRKVSETGNHISVFRGSTGFAANVKPAWTIDAPAVGDSGTAVSFGDSLAVVGDVNGDGYDDIAAQSVVAGGATGPTYLFFGGASGPASTPSAALTVPNSHYLSAAERIGDVNGDGFADLVLYSDANFSAAVFVGGPTGPSDMTRHTLPQPAGVGGNFLGWSRGAGDVDGDGIADFVMSDNFRSPNNSQNAGQVFVYKGQSGPGLFTPAWTLSGDQANGQIAGGAFVGDVNVDGFDDFVLGEPIADSEAGRAFFYAGSAGGSATRRAER